MMPTKHVLENGLRLHLIPYEGTQAVTVFALCGVGSRYEYEEINGAAHFIEHLMFKGTKRRPTTLDISRTLDAIGAEYNAFTGKDITAYYVKAASEHTGLATDMICDMLTGSLYDEVEMDRERGVIIEEINMYHDNPMMHVEDLLETTMFAGSTLGWEIAGSHETMRGMTRDQVIAFRDEHYVPSNMVVVMAGKVPENAREIVEQTFGTMKAAEKSASRYIAFANDQADLRVAVEYKDTKQMQLALGFPSFGHADERNRAVTLLSTILGGTMSSRLFINVRERRGLGYFVRSSNSPYEDTGVFAIQAGLDTSRLAEAYTAILEEVEKMKTTLVSDEELQEAKDHVRGKLLLKLENSSERAGWWGMQELHLDKVTTPEDYTKQIDAVTKEQILAVAKELFVEHRLSVAAIGPYKTTEAFKEVIGS